MKAVTLALTGAMSPALKLLVATIGCVAMTAAFAATAHATEPRQVSGTWSVTPQTPTGIKPAGVNLKLDGVSSSTWTGDLSGTTVAQATFVIHPDGRIVAAPVRETFTGAVAGTGTGTVEFAEEAHAQPDGSTEIDATIVRGTGDLARLHGRIIFIGNCDPSGACTGTYAGQFAL